MKRLILAIAVVAATVQAGPLRLTRTEVIRMADAKMIQAIGADSQCAETLTQLKAETDNARKVALINKLVTLLIESTTCKEESCQLLRRIVEFDTTRAK